MVTILMMSAKTATLGLLKIRVFWNKVFDVVISAHDVTNKFLSLDSNYIIDMACDQSLVTVSFLWEKLA